MLLILKVIEVPLPTLVPVPQPPAYHFHDAPVPRVPPLRVRVVLVPRQPLSLVAVIRLGITLVSFVCSILLTQGVVLQVPIARTK